MQVAFKQTPELKQESYLGELDELRGQAARLTHLVNVLPAGVVILNEFGFVEEANQIAIDLLGEPLINLKWLEVIKRSFNPQADDGHEVSLHDGRRVKLETIDLSPERGQLILITNLTETRLLQARLNHLSQLSVLGKMMASLAHQIRTPLSAAMLYAANLANQSLNKTAQSNFQKKLVARLHDLESQINDMLLFAKSGQKQVAEKLSLQQLLSEVQAGSEAMIIQNHGQLTAELPEPDILIFGNQNALASAIQNLIHNSIQMIPKGAQIRVSAKRSDKDPSLVWIQVSDNGPGISPELQQSVFDPFYTTRTKGTGLGLAVVKSVAEQHQGRVFIDSKPEQGCTFTIELAVAENAVLAQVAGQN
ncbi:sensor histidine kinase [Catenovulum maritimum]|uniref:histidine kinase n=1 Tax=Catenovulum maritimum TaxID=1513271 RepID=A0A0J8GVB7_9ALTE|nr:HAMP domain-containing sensor histidine kinase [Catenovulum maritimum]KMT66682.1 histidine kinase [Catenovulum maritimum]